MSQPTTTPATRIVSPAMLAAAAAFGQAHGISGAIDPNDFILWFIVDSSTDPVQAVTDYLESGIHAARLLHSFINEARILAVLDQRTEPALPLGVLEFAAGYGRVTRHFPAVLPGAHITACDIHAQAVDFLRGIGFDACPSAHQPAAFDLGRTFDVIYVFSFFTHMPRATWTPWLQALSRHLSPHGVLVFTAHGAVSQALMGVAAVDDDGFFFHPFSEQKDLAAGEYGNTITLFDYVHAQLQASGLGLLQFKEAAAGHHDVYVVHHRPTLPTPPDPRHLQLAAMRSSTSWRVTGPLRALGRVLGRWRRGRLRPLESATPTPP